MSMAIFLDRDGVLNRAFLNEKELPVPPRTREEFSLLPGASEACADLKKAGYKLVCVTNQPDIARGTANLELVDWINRRVTEACQLDKLKVCPHDDTDACACRKPKPGMLLDAAAELGIDISRSFMIGDRFRDIEAGQAAGCRTILVDYDYPERLPNRPPDHVARTMREAADFVLASYPFFRLNNQEWSLDDR